MDEYTIKLNPQHLQVIRGALGKVAFDLAEPLIRTIGEQVQRQDAERAAKPLEMANGEAVEATAAN